MQPGPTSKITRIIERMGTAIGADMEELKNEEHLFSLIQAKNSDSVDLLSAEESEFLRSKSLKELLERGLGTFTEKLSLLTEELEGKNTSVLRKIKTVTDPRVPKLKTLIKRLTNLIEQMKVMAEREKERPQNTAENYDKIETLKDLAEEAESRARIALNPSLENSLKPEPTPDISVEVGKETQNGWDPRQAIESFIGSSVEKHKASLTPKSVELIEQIVVGSVIFYKGKNYEVKELPNEQNGNRYILTSPGEPVFKANKKQLTKALESKDGKLILPNTEVEIIKERMTRRAQEIAELKRALVQIKKESVPTPAETIKAPKVEIFSAEFIKAIVLPLLEPHVSKIESFKLDGIGEEMILNTTIISLGGTIKIQATLVNKDGAIILKNPPTVDAIWPYKGKAEKKIAPHLDKISETIKEFIETEKKKKTGVDVQVRKMEIVDGELKVTYK